MKQILLAAVLALTTQSPLTAHAHGSAKARHGGVVQMAHDLGFELVVAADQAAIYIEDHGKPLPATGFSGKLTVLQAGTSSEAPITVDGERLVAKVQLAKGAKVVASLMRDGKALSVRFTVK
ncbi:hypothetical protein HNQ51_000280 [Inhella inkyongensis]|uniref:Uncharacterized protein n=1 Tax=Inhella inkyongensis TaxID=392593 RepID=A0A840RWC6_9BURK|nr:hypothetical protein [Inhella inkyongensis]MBB5202987.1 hypothetical protein [Inhella inkyongensis]